MAAAGAQLPSDHLEKRSLVPASFSTKEEVSAPDRSTDHNSAEPSKSPLAGSPALPANNFSKTVQGTLENQAAVSPSTALPPPLTKPPPPKISAPLATFLPPPIPPFEQKSLQKPSVSSAVSASYKERNGRVKRRRLEQKSPMQPLQAESMYPFHHTFRPIPGERLPNGQSLYPGGLATVATPSYSPLLPLSLAQPSSEPGSMRNTTALAEITGMYMGIPWARNASDIQAPQDGVQARPLPSVEVRMRRVNPYGEAPEGFQKCVGCARARKGTAYCYQIHILGRTDASFRSEWKKRGAAEKNGTDAGTNGAWLYGSAEESAAGGADEKTAGKKVQALRSQEMGSSRCQREQPHADGQVSNKAPYLAGRMPGEAGVRLLTEEERRRVDRDAGLGDAILDSAPGGAEKEPGKAGGEVLAEGGRTMVTREAGIGDDILAIGENKVERGSGAALAGAGAAIPGKETERDPLSKGHANGDENAEGPRDVTPPSAANFGDSRGKPLAQQSMVEQSLPQQRPSEAERRFAKELDGGARKDDNGAPALGDESAQGQWVESVQGGEVAEPEKRGLAHLQGGVGAEVGGQVASQSRDDAGLREGRRDVVGGAGDVQVEAGECAETARAHALESAGDERPTTGQKEGPGRGVKKGAKSAVVVWSEVPEEGTAEQRHVDNPSSIPSGRETAEGLCLRGAPVGVTPESTPVNTVGALASMGASSVEKPASAGETASRHELKRKEPNNPPSDLGDGPRSLKTLERPQNKRPAHNSCLELKAGSSGIAASRSMLQMPNSVESIAGGVPVPEPEVELRCGMCCKKRKLGCGTLKAALGCEKWGGGMKEPGRGGDKMLSRPPFQGPTDLSSVLQARSDPNASLFTLDALASPALGEKAPATSSRIPYLYFGTAPGQIATPPEDASHGISSVGPNLPSYSQLSPYVSTAAINLPPNSHTTPALAHKDSPSASSIAHFNQSNAGPRGASFVEIYSSPPAKAVLQTHTQSSETPLLSSGPLLQQVSQLFGPSLPAPPSQQIAQLFNPPGKAPVSVPSSSNPLATPNPPQMYQNPPADASQVQRNPYTDSQVPALYSVTPASLLAAHYRNPAWKAPPQNPAANLFQIVEISNFKDSRNLSDLGASARLSATRGGESRGPTVCLGALDRFMGGSLGGQPSADVIRIRGGGPRLRKQKRGGAETEGGKIEKAEKMEQGGGKRAVRRTAARGEVSGEVKDAEEGQGEGGSGGKAVGKRGAKGSDVIATASGRRIRGPRGSVERKEGEGGEATRRGKLDAGRKLRRGRAAKKQTVKTEGAVLRRQANVLDVDASETVDMGSGRKRRTRQSGVEKKKGTAEGRGRGEAENAEQASGVDIDGSENVKRRSSRRRKTLPAAVASTSGGDLEQVGAMEGGCVGGKRQRKGGAHKATGAQGSGNAPSTVRRASEREKGGVPAREGLGRRPLIVFAHGAGAGASSAFMQRWRGLLKGATGAVEVVTFDYPYLADGKKGMPPKAEKLIDFHTETIREAQKKHPGCPLVLAGKSMGSRVSCMIGGQEGNGLDIAAVVCLGYPLKGMGKGPIREQTLLDLKCPVLFVQGSRDSMCPLHLLADVRSRISVKTDLHIVDGGDHGLSVGVKTLRAQERTMEEVEESALEAIASFLGPLL